MTHAPAPPPGIAPPDIAELRAVRAALRVWLCEWAAWLVAVLPARSWLGAAVRIVVTGALRGIERDVKDLAFEFAWLRLELGPRRRRTRTPAPPPGFRLAYRHGSALRRATRGVFRGPVALPARIDRIRAALDDMERVIDHILRRVVRLRLDDRPVLIAAPAHFLPIAAAAAPPTGADTS